MPHPSTSSAYGIWSLNEVRDAVRGDNWPFDISLYPLHINQSLRFNDDDSAYLSRTPSSAGNRKTWTWSGWVKRGNLGIAQTFFGTRGASPGNSNTLQFGFNTANQFQLGLETAYFLVSTSLYRDTSSWYHIVFELDTTQASASDRVKVYINGEEVTAWGTDLRSSISQNSDLGINIGSQLHQLGALISNSWYLDGYMAEVHFTDGYKYDADDFGELKSGVWVPKEVSVSYGTNGFYLDFADSSAIGNDESGNDNDWTPNNFTASDVVLDSPTDNFATLNPLHISSSTTLSDGNLKVVGSNTTNFSSQGFGSIGLSSGKWYWEIECTNQSTTNECVAVSKSSDRNNVNPTTDTNGAVVYRADGYLFTNGSQDSNFGSSWGDNDVISIALDMDAGKVWFAKNNVWQGLGSPSTGLDPAASGLTVPYSPSYRILGGTFTFNFGQQDFTYTPPTGYLALTTANLSVPAAIDPAQGASPQDYFNTVLYTGDSSGGGRAISNVGFQPDLVWLKTRSTAYHHQLHDSVRGATTGALYSSLTNAEDSNYPIDSFDADGFTLASSLSDYGSQNANGTTYAAWNWKESQASGFDNVSYAGTGSDNTISHNLGSVPSCIIIKDRSATNNWIVWHSAIHSTTSESDVLTLNTINANGAFGATYIESVTDSSFVIKSNYSATNTSGRNYLCYAFAEVEGFSKFGSYTGNGSADGPFVYTGFRPAFVMVKYTSGSGGSWVMYDNKRVEYNLNFEKVRADSSDAENASYVGGDTLGIDNLSNGFKIRVAGGSNHNVSSGTYIYIAFAENPFKYSNAR